MVRGAVASFVGFKSALLFADSPCPSTLPIHAIPPDLARRGRPAGWAGRAWVTSDADWGSLGALVSVGRRRPAYSTGASIQPHACMLYGCHSVRSSRPILRRAPASSNATAGAQLPSRAMQRVSKIRMWNESGTVGWPLHASELATFLQSTSASCKSTLDSAWCCSGFSQRHLPFAFFPSFSSVAITP